MRRDGSKRHASTARANAATTNAAGRATVPFAAHRPADSADTRGVDDRRRRILAIVAASSGNLVEWFDFYIYAFTAIYFAPAFFPKSDPTAQLLDTAAVFAAGFFMRPVGGWLFGRLADRVGRRRAMVVSVALMCVGSLGIACLPVRATIGVAAPVLLLVARLVQGLSVGGEYGTTATYLSEIAVHGRRGFASSFQYVTLIGGQLLAVLVIAVLERVLTADELRAWGWRIPFALGAVTAVLVLLLRRRLHETHTGDARHGSTLQLLREHPRAFVSVMLYTAGGSLFFYTFTTYMQKYLVNSVGFAKTTTSAIMTVALLVFMLLQPAFGALSDRIGRRRSMMLFGVLGAVVVVPVLAALRATGEPVVAALLIVATLAVLSLYTSVSAIVKAEMFPAEVRALGVGFAYALGNALFGGTAEYVALALKRAGHETVYGWYVTAMTVVFLIVSRRLPRQPRYLDHAQ
jgi:MFS transporter, MHS family, dicarboxylic acid transporter PcaT